MTGVWCTDLELSGPALLVSPAPGRYAAVRILVRLHGVPLGLVELPLAGDELDPAVVLKTVDAELLDAVNEHLAADGAGPLASVSSVPPAGSGCSSRYLPVDRVTVVVCTRNRAQSLAACFASLARLEYPQLEILIIDNAPPDDATQRAFDVLAGGDPRFRYIREPRPGLSCARNRGLREATGDLIAFTDDDVSVDPDWVRALAAAFADPDVACVTGLVCTASIDGPAERYFDARVSWGDSFRPVTHRIGGETDDGLFPYATGIYGTGASFAVRAGTFRELGGFDEALGAGTHTAGGEDLDAFVRVILAGYSLAYQPAAVVWHRHRADLAGLRRQVFSYGTGTSAFIAKQILGRSTRGHVLRRIPRGVRRVMSTANSTQSSLDGVPAQAQEVPAKALLLRELAGLAAGPALYARARRAIPPQST